MHLLTSNTHVRTHACTRITYRDREQRSERDVEGNNTSFKYFVIKF